MKLKKITNQILKIIACVLICSGIFLGLGSIGACEQNNITLLQFFVQEIIAFVLIVLSFVVFYIRCLIR